MAITHYEDEHIDTTSEGERFRQLWMALGAPSLEASLPGTFQEFDFEVTQRVMALAHDRAIDPSAVRPGDKPWRLAR